jgi:hypothetical protein
VTVQAQQRIVAVHAAAIIGHPDLGLAAVLNLDADACGGRIERILDQLLDH